MSSPEEIEGLRFFDDLRYQGWGHLFQGRYKAILCEKNSYLFELSAYIHLNPVRAKLVKDPAEYPWSSYREYLEGGSGGLVDGSFVSSQFSKVKGRAGSDKDFEARLRRLERVITLGQKRKIRN